MRVIRIAALLALSSVPAVGAEDRIDLFIRDLFEVKASGLACHGFLGGSERYAFAVDAYYSKIMGEHILAGRSVKHKGESFQDISSMRVELSKLEANLSGSAQQACAKRLNDAISSYNSTWFEFVAITKGQLPVPPILANL